MSRYIFCCVYFLLRILLGCVCVNCELKKNIGVSNALKIVLDISSLSISLLTNFVICFLLCLHILERCHQTRWPDCTIFCFCLSTNFVVSIISILLFQLGFQILEKLGALRQSNCYSSWRTSPRCHCSHSTHSRSN